MVATGGGGPGVTDSGDGHPVATLPAVARCVPLSRSSGFAARVLLLGIVGLAVGCAGHDGREMVANGIGETPEATSTTTSAPATSSSLPQGTIPDGSGSVGMDPGEDSGAGPGSAAGSVYVDSVSGTVGGTGSYDLSHPQLDGLAIGLPVNEVLRRPTEAVRAEFVAALSERSVEEEVDSGSGEAGPGDSLRGAGTVYLLDERLVSVVYEMRIDWAGAADVDERIDSVLVDLSAGAELGLRDLFVPESPWLETIGFFVRRDLEARLGEGVLWPDGRGLDPEASNFAVFGVTATELVVRFPMHAVAPGVAGTPEAAVPWASLAGLVDPQGPAGHLTG